MSEKSNKEYLKDIISIVESLKNDIQTIKNDVFFIKQSLKVEKNIKEEKETQTESSGGWYLFSTY